MKNLTLGPFKIKPLLSIFFQTVWNCLIKNPMNGTEINFRTIKHKMRIILYSKWSILDVWKSRDLSWPPVQWTRPAALCTVSLESKDPPAHQPFLPSSPPPWSNMSSKFYRPRGKKELGLQLGLCWDFARGFCISQILNMWDWPELTHQQSKRDWCFYFNNSELFPRLDLV
jgi:hypothetical protein